MIKTVELTGVEMKIEGLDGKNTAIYNKTSAAVYASCSPNITPNADGVMEIPSGGCRGLTDTCGIIYLLGTGKVELTGTDDSVNFRQPSSSSGGGGENSPAEEQMPYMNGIVGYYTPNTLDISGGRWKNLLEGNDIILSGGSAENECLHLTKDDFGTLTIDEPSTIYLMFCSFRASEESDSYFSVISKEMTTFERYHDFAVVENQYKIALSCRLSFIGSNTSPSQVHVVCITRNTNTAKLYVDGDLMGQTRADFGDYGGVYHLNKSIRGGIESDSPGEHSYKMVAFGYTEHTAEEIASNSQWLKNRTFRW